MPPPTPHGLKADVIGQLRRIQVRHHQCAVNGLLWFHCQPNWTELDDSSLNLSGPRVLRGQHAPSLPAT